MTEELVELLVTTAHESRTDTGCVSLSVPELNGIGTTSSTYKKAADGLRSAIKTRLKSIAQERQIIAAILALQRYQRSLKPRDRQRKQIDGVVGMLQEMIKE